MTLRRCVVMVAVLGLSASACGGGGENADESAEESASIDESGDETRGETPEERSTEDSSADEVAAESASTTTSSTSAPTTTSTTVAPLAVASAEMIDANVEYRTANDTEFSGLTTPVDVAVGDAVRTDATGFATVAYFDGSLTRLDVNTEFEVLELVDDVDESVVRTKMGLGRTWHRVQTLGEGGAFSVETSVATAVVQGTAFSVECVSETECTFLVVEGTVLVVLEDGTEVELVAPAAVTIDEDGAGDVVVVPFDGAFGDEWLFDNAQRDVVADPAWLSAAEIFQAHGVEFGSIAGTYAGTRTVTSLDCVTVCLDNAPVGDVADRSYVFEVDCTAGVPCSGTIDTEYVRDGAKRDTTVVEFDGTSYRWTLEVSGAACSSDLDGDGVYETPTGNTDTRLVWVMTPTAAEIIDDRWVVTDMSDLGEGGWVNTVTDPGECTGPDNWQGDTATSDIVVSRVR